MVWVIAFGELFFGDLWCVVWGYGGMRTHFSLLNPHKKWVNIKKNPRLGGGKYRGFRPRFPHKENGACSL